MKRSLTLFRGAKGYSWYNHYLQHGQEGFKNFTPPTPFDWSANPKPRSKAYFEMKMDNESLGKLVIELAEDVVPKTVENFKRLCLGQGSKYSGYKGTKIHLVRKGEVLMGGDVEKSNGASTHSSYEHRYIKDENFIIPHSERGLIR